MHNISAATQHWSTCAVRSCVHWWIASRVRCLAGWSP